ncbi:Alpha/Beta hydrolase protein [Cladochytrium replicatum]|nr:Alpha/Beta hydrolase protein [Cladochytrium replicatum]
MPALSAVVSLLSLSLAASALPGLLFQDHSVPHDSSFRLPSSSLSLASRPPASALKISHSKEWTTFALPKAKGYKLRMRRNDDISQLCDPTVASFAGYFDVGDSKHLFFWFFESRSSPETDPLLMWTNGGPGCSSATGLFMELGPCRVEEGGNSTFYNPYGWNNKANIIFIDHPANVGWSYSDGSGSSVPKTSEEDARDLYFFFQILLQAIPELQLLDFHISGESYAGHYIPALAHEIVAMNDDIVEPDEDWRVHINLASVLIGNGITDALVQFREIPSYAEENGYVTPLYPAEVTAKMRQRYPTCAKLIKACYSAQNSFVCVPATLYCGWALESADRNGRNPYDIRMKCSETNPLCYDILNDVDSFLNNPEVKAILGVVDKKFESCSNDIGLRFTTAGDIARPAQGYVKDLLERGIRVLIYVGDADSVCDWIGNLAWTKELEWSGQDGYNDADELTWIVNGRSAGTIRSYENLTFIRIFEAGHMVPYDQGEVSDEMVQAWLAGASLV